MSAVLKIPIQPSYRKENGIFVIAIDDIVLPSEFKVKQKAVINIPAKQIAGNHKHPRTECFISITQGLKLVWLDKEGKKYEKHMREGKELFLWILASNTPHAVINAGDGEGVLLEYADDVQHDVERVEIV